MFSSKSYLVSSLSNLTQFTLFPNTYLLIDVAVNDKNL